MVPGASIIASGGSDETVKGWGREDCFMRNIIRLALAASLLTSAACATTSPEATSVAVAPNYAPLAGAPTGPHADLYADCLRQGAERRAYRQVIDDGAELLLFTCYGPAAQDFYDALGPHSAAVDSAFQANGRSYRSTARVQRNMVGVDHCSVDAAGADAQCVLTFNAGDFLVAP